MKTKIFEGGLRFDAYWPRSVLKKSLALFEGAYIFGPNGYVNAIKNVEYKYGAIFAEIPDEIVGKELHIDCTAIVKLENKKHIVATLLKINGFLFDEELWQTEEGSKHLAERRV